RHRRVHVRAARPQRAGDRDPRGLSPHHARPAALARDRPAHAARRLGPLDSARAEHLTSATWRASTMNAVPRAGLVERCLLLLVLDDRARGILTGSRFPGDHPMT